MENGLAGGRLAYVQEVKREEKGVVDLVGVFNHHVMSKYSEFVHIYTDGSKQPETGVTGFGVAIPSRGIGINRRTSDRLGVYTVEMLGVLVALKWVEAARADRVVICTDSAAVLASLRSSYSSCRQGLLYNVLQLTTKIVQEGGRVHFLWVPAHVGVTGNEKADELAKKALEKGKVEMNVSISKAEVKCIIWEKVNQMWQDQWDGEVKGRSFHNLQKSIKVNRVGSGQRREEIVLTRLRLGHSGLNSTLNLVGKHQTGLCEGCQDQEQETVEHVIMYCRGYESERVVMRNQMRAVGVQDVSIEGLLRMGDRRQVKILLEFLREAGVYDRI